MIPEKTSSTTSANPTAPTHSSNDDPSDSTSPLLPKPTESEAHSSSFDLKVAKYSLILDFIAFAGMGLAADSLVFSFFGVLGSFGIGFSPAAEATLLALFLRRGDTETGKLFGAIGLVQALWCAFLLCDHNATHIIDLFSFT